MTNQKRVELKQIVQVCTVVKDIQKAVKQYWEFGIGPWSIYTWKPPELTNTTFHGKPAKYSMKLALAMIGNVMWELIEPLEGPSTYKEFLEKKGEGLHHVLLAVDDFNGAVATLGEKGIGILMKGDYKGLTYAYLDTERELGTVVEIYKPLDWAPPKPEATYPPSTSET
jgi:hypothetical protein